MTAQKQISGETDKALRHLLDVLLRAIYKTTAGSAKFLVYLVCSIAVLNIIGYEQISTLNIQPAIYYIIQGVLASPLINRLVEQLAGDLLANRIENVINNSQSDKEILKFIDRLVKENELNEKLDILLQKSPLVKEDDFWRVVSRQQRENQKHTAMLELLVAHAIAESPIDNGPLELPSRMLIENFVNRDIELKQLLDNLYPGKTIIITGSGGVGKSALIAKAIWEIYDEFKLIDRFPDGIVIYDCSLQADINIASATIAQNFGYPTNNDPNILRNILNSKKALIIFDNAEEINLEALILGQYSCGILITSRRRLAIEGINIELERLSDARGEELLIKLLPPKIAVDIEFVRAIVRELDGLPLALTLASKRIRSGTQTPISYLQVLKNSLSTLEIANSRVQSLPLVIQESISSVSDPARLILFVLANHASRPITDITFAIAFHPNFQYSIHQIREALSELINHSLIQVHKVDVQKGAYIPLYGFKHNLIHRFIREYASKDWNEEWNKLLDRLITNVILEPLGAFIRESRAEEPRIDESSYSDSLYLDALVLLENLIREERWHDAIRCAEIVYLHAQEGNNFIERKQILNAGLRAAIELKDEFGQTSILIELADTVVQQNELNEAEEILKRSLNLARSNKNVEHEVKIIDRLANLFHDMDNHAKAFDFRQQAVSLLGSIDNKGIQFETLANFGVALVRLRYGQPKQAISLLQSALQIAINENNTYPIARIYHFLGVALTAAQNEEEAIVSLRNALKFAEQNRQKIWELRAKSKLGNIYLMQGQVENARLCYSEARKLAITLDDRLAHAANSGNLGTVYEELGDKKEAVKYLREALNIFEENNAEQAQITRDRINKLLEK